MRRAFILVLALTSLTYIVGALSLKQPSPLSPGFENDTDHTLVNWRAGRKRQCDQKVVLLSIRVFFLAPP